MKMATAMGATVAVLGVMASLSPPAGAEPSAAEIAAKAYTLDGGEDSLSRLTFTFHKADGSERKLVYAMAWKRYPPGGESTAKALFFSEYPPDDRGKSYMIWLSADRSRQDDEWMYLPELRMVRKLTHDKGHRHKDRDDDFARSLLAQVNLVPRNPDLDRHRLLREEAIKGHSAYLIESVPKQPVVAFPYAKTRRWISKEDFLPERIDYYGDNGEVVLQQTILWKQVDGVWVWERVVGAKSLSQERTELDISDIRVNNHLSDEVFSRRTMRLGADSLGQ